MAEKKVVISYTIPDDSPKALAIKDMSIARRKEFIADVNSGMYLEEIQKKYDLPTKTVFKICGLYGLRNPEGRKYLSDIF